MHKSHSYSLITLMNSRLQYKYKNILSFYQVKSINQILAMNPHCTTYMDFCDFRILSEDIQYLKRVYYYRTLTGKPEIEQCMKMICQHYATNPAISTFTYQYPMMIITNTKSLFIRRKKRLKKIQAGQASSDFTEQREQQYLQFQPKSENFLEDLQNSLISEECQDQSQVSFESNCYDIFSQASLQLFLTQKMNFDISQENIKHLIQDYKHQNFAQRQQINHDGELPSASLSNHALTNIENQPKNHKQSLFSNPQLENRPKIEKKEIKSSLLGSMISQILQKPINFSNFGRNLQKLNNYQDKNLGLDSERQSLQKQREQRARRRQQIREKAEELLRKVRNNAEIQQ